MGLFDNIEEFYYQLYGLTLRSNQPLPGLKFSGNKIPQVEINLTSKEAFEIPHLAEDTPGNHNFSWQTKVTSEGRVINVALIVAIKLLFTI